MNIKFFFIVFLVIFLVLSSILTGQNAFKVGEVSTLPGEKIGYITDYFGNVIQDVVSSYSGIILYIVATLPMSKGEPMAFVGKF